MINQQDNNFIKTDKKFVNANLKDSNIKLELLSNNKLLENFDINYLIYINKLFEEERIVSNDYNLYGYLDNSKNFLYNVKISGTSILDFSNKVNDLTNNEYYNIYNQFDIYVIIPYKYTLINDELDIFRKDYKIISNINDLFITQTSFSKNIFNEQIYSYLSNKNFNIDNKTILFNKYDVELSITELALLTIPKNKTISNLDFNSVININDINNLPNYEMGYSENDVISDSLLRLLTNNELISFRINYEKDIRFLLSYFNIRITLDNFIILKNKILSYINFIPSYSFYESFNINDEVIKGELYHFDKNTYTFNLLSEQKHQIEYNIKDNILVSASETNIPREEYLSNYYTGISYSYVDNNRNIINVDFKFTYNPIKPIIIKKYSSYFEIANNLTTDNIPSYSIKLDDNNYIWRDLLDVGVFEDNGNGIDYPFINNSHYLFNKIDLEIKPDLSDNNTYNLFKSLKNEFTITSNKINNKNNPLTLC